MKNKIMQILRNRNVGFKIQEETVDEIIKFILENQVGQKELSLFIYDSFTCCCCSEDAESSANYLYNNFYILKKGGE